MKWYPNVAYSPYFPILFKKEKEEILKSIKKAKIEHIGSTSIPGLDGKGYIDLIIAVPKKEMGNAKKILETVLGYEYKKDVSVIGKRLFFLKIKPTDYSNDTHFHLHLTYLNSNEYKQALFFRNFLFKNPDYLKKYSEIKKIASKKAQFAKDKKEAKLIYKKLKDPLIKEILNYL